MNTKSIALLSLILVSICQSTVAHEGLSWHEAQKAIIKKGKYVVSNYDPEICVWSTKTYELMLAPEYDTQAWDLAKRVIQEVMIQLPVYTKALDNPFDDIYWSELLLQSSMIGGQLAAQMHKNSFEFTAKVGAIIGCYIEILRDMLRKA